MKPHFARLLAIVMMVLFVAGITSSCRKAVTIKTVPSEAVFEFDQDARRPIQRELVKRQFETPSIVELEQRTHFITVEKPDYMTTRYEINARPLNFWEIISFQWLFVRGKLDREYTFFLTPSLDAVLRGMALELATDVAPHLPPQSRATVLYPFVRPDKAVSELGVRLTNHTADALDRRLGYRPRMMEFTQVRRFLVENDMGLGAGAMGTGADFAFYARQLNVDTIIVARMRYESTPGREYRDPFATRTDNTGSLRVDLSVIEPASGNTLRTVSRTIPAGPEIKRLYDQTIAEETVSLRQELLTGTRRLALQMLEGYKIRQGPVANVKFIDFSSNPTFWGRFVRQEFERLILTESRGTLTPVPETMAGADLGFDPARRQAARPQLLSEYQFTFVGEVFLLDDQVTLIGTLRQPNGDVLLTERVEFTLTEPGIQRREWQAPPLN